MLASPARREATTATGSPYGYVWAHDEFSPTFTGLTNFSHNSAGATNTITRISTGRYQVRFGGLASTGGTVKVTAFGAGNFTVKAQNPPAGAKRAKGSNVTIVGF